MQTNQNNTGIPSMNPRNSMQMVHNKTSYTEELEEQNRQLRALFEKIQEAIFSVDLENQRILLISPSHNKIYGRSEKEFLENINLWQEVIHPEDKRLLPNIYQNISSGISFSTEYRIIRGDGEVRWIENRITPSLNTMMKPIRIDGIISDITIRKEAEKKANEQFEELQKTNFELDRFVYSVSHDLRAPLTSILGILNIAEQDDLSEQSKIRAGMIRESVTRLDIFIRNILHYSRNSRMEIRSEEINVREILSDTRNNLRFMKGVEKLKLKAEIDERIPFYSDSMRIRILFNNLFSNAIKYLDPSKGESFIRVKVVNSENESRIEISDNGIGIDKEHIEKIFNMFYRASHKQAGSGLGLYILKETIAKLKGSISVESEPGKGTKFIVTLPNSYNKKA